MNDDVTSGIHPFAKEVVQKFNNNEQQIVKIFSQQWYVTKAGKSIIGASEYDYILIKATNNFSEQFNLVAEVIVVFSNYDKFEPRTLDAFDNIKNKLEMGRVENLCGILVSKDKNIASAIKQYLAEQETRIIVPFSYCEIIDNKDDNYIFRNKLRKYFYKRDLFAFNNPLKTDIYFFGRNQVVMDIINKHLSNQNSGLFGLRKTGKTSIIYDVKRKLTLKGSIGVFIDCQSPSITQRTWNYDLCYLLKLICNELNVSSDDIVEDNFTETSATDLFAQKIDRLVEQTGKKILLLFDEIENITFKKSPNDRWCNGLESVYFWQAIRSVYQRQRNNFTFCLFGTNPSCVEMPTILEKDNPIFNIITPMYIPGFDVVQTREMVRKLGRIMGMKFDETLYGKMTEDYGGHPFLIRHLCSTISKQNSERPVSIDRIKYSNAKEEFNKSKSDYFEMLIAVLKQFYPDEYEMLQYLAIGDIDTFEYFANVDYSYVQHLIGYGIIQVVDGNYDFRIDSIKEFIIRKKNLKKICSTKEEKWSSICCERGNLEIDFRKMVKQVILIAYKGKVNAKEYVINKIYGDKRRQYSTYTYEDLFDSKKSEIYLKNLTILVKCNWEYFSTFFYNLSQEDFIYCMSVLNKEGRFDAHAKIPSDEDMVLFNAAISKISESIKKYEEVCN